MKYLQRDILNTIDSFEFFEIVYKDGRESIKGRVIKNDSSHPFFDTYYVFLVNGLSLIVEHKDLFKKVINSSIKKLRKEDFLNKVINSKIKK